MGIQRAASQSSGGGEGAVMWTGGVVFIRVSPEANERMEFANAGAQQNTIPTKPPVETGGEGRLVFGHLGTFETSFACGRKIEGDIINNLFLL